LRASLGRPFFMP